MYKVSKSKTLPSFLSTTTTGGLVKPLLASVTVFLLAILTGCDDDDDENTADETGIRIESLSYIDEIVIPKKFEFEGTTLGGLSGIDYANGQYYLISDDANQNADDIAGPIRFYTAEINFDENRIESLLLTSVNEIRDTNNASFTSASADPESIRVNPTTGNLVWVSEGFINSGVNPFIREMTADGTHLRELSLPAAFQIADNGEAGPRHNTVFEGITISADQQGYWAAMEGPLVQDGDAPSISEGQYFSRVVYFDKTSGEPGKQFAYPLDPIVVRADAPADAFRVTGLVELLEYAQDHFLVMERSFTAGLSDGGNNVKIYRVDASQVSDVRDLNSLQGQSFQAARKTLLFDFESVRSKLTDGIVDNIEGMTLGPILPNGKQSLVLVADDNFSAFGPQLNQFVVMQIER